MARFTKNLIACLVLISWVWMLSSCSSNSNKVELTLSAAASLTDALQEAKAIFEAQNPSIQINFNFGGSGALSQQIEQGAPVDLFLSASSPYMDALIDKNLVESKEQQLLLQNELVVIIPTNSPITIEDINDLTKPTIKHIAVGTPEIVPAGGYTKEALTSAKLWDRLVFKMVQAKDVRQVLQYVETGNADAGFVYRTDAMSSKQVQIAYHIDPKTYSVIQYPVGIVKATKNRAEAERLYRFLQTKEAQNIFVKYGFSIPA